jgi:glycyl-tRNA synthetase beta chain
MSDTRNLLVELFVEELPPKALKKLGEAFATVLADSLKAQGLAAADAAVTSYASPRRLAVQVANVATVAPDAEVNRKVMPASVALDASGKPTQAFRKAMAKLGREHLCDLLPDAVDGPDKLLLQSDGKAEAFFLRSLAKGTALTVGLQNALDDAITKLPIPKVMQYQLETGPGPDFQPGWTSVNFVRPAHGLVALHGAEVVPVTALGLASGRTTQGHRFEARVPTLTLRDADSYAGQLRDEGAVIASFADRREEIVRQLTAAAAAEGLTPIDDDALLDEVTALVERPKVLLCRFEPEFLAVPQECLILTMKANQKYFPLLDGQGRLTDRFLIVSNIDPADPGRVIQGNERVVRPRLADAKFFFDQDRKKSLAARVPQLAKVVYHGKLGTQGERVERVRSIARGIGLQIGGAALAEQADRAALLAKADLLTDMVGEFPELQGIMGGYYARHDGESEAVAFAVEDHYKPRFAGDALPRVDAGDAGTVVALADKLETLAGLFGIGQLPSGDKDPFALRRHALGVIRMLVERQLPLALPALVSAAFHAFPAGHGQAQAEVLHFLYDRLVGYLRELGYSAREVDAVIALRPASWAELPARLAAVRAFAALPEAEALAAANKRVGNILKKSEGGAEAALDPALLVEAAERGLAAALASLGPVALADFERGDYTASLKALAGLRAPVDAFFDHVMVNAEDLALRANRLALLRGLHAAMNRVADLARLAS